jgi:hypothetical protein
MLREPAAKPGNVYVKGDEVLVAQRTVLYTFAGAAPTASAGIVIV